MSDFLVFAVFASAVVPFGVLFAAIIHDQRKRAKQYLEGVP